MRRREFIAALGGALTLGETLAAHDKVLERHHAGTEDSARVSADESTRLAASRRRRRCGSGIGSRVLATLSPREPRICFGSSLSRAASAAGMSFPSSVLASTGYKPPETMVAEDAVDFLGGAQKREEEDPPPGSDEGQVCFREPLGVVATRACIGRGSSRKVQWLTNADCRWCWGAPSSLASLPSGRLGLRITEAEGMSERGEPIDQPATLG
jgi:hypothetical protein